MNRQEMFTLIDLDLRKKNEKRFPARRLEASLSFIVNGHTDQVFPKLSPVECNPWLPSFDGKRLTPQSSSPQPYYLISETYSGNLFFQEPNLTTNWYIFEHDVKSHGIDACILSNKPIIGRYTAIITPKGNTSSMVTLKYMYTAFNEQGNRFLNNDFQNKMEQMLQLIKQSIEEKQANSSLFDLKQTNPVEDPENHFIPVNKGNHHDEIIHTRGEDYFSLFCPVAELLWIKDWTYTLYYSDSGWNEDNCLFHERLSPMGIFYTPTLKTYWYTVKYDRNAKQFHAILYTPGLMIGKFESSIQTLSEDKINIHWELLYTGISPDGNAILMEEDFKERIKNKFKLLAPSIKTYIETGKLYNIPLKMKFRMFINILAKHIKRKTIKNETLFNNPTIPSFECKTKQIGKI